jgi:hypothetical protein
MGHEWIVDFRAYHKTASPKQVSRLLGLKPSHSVLRGKKWRAMGMVTNNGWFLSSRALVPEQAPVQEHVDTLLAVLNPVQGGLRQLRALKWDMDLVVFNYDYATEENTNISRAIQERLDQATVDLGLATESQVQARQARLDASRQQGEKTRALILARLNRSREKKPGT